MSVEFDCDADLCKNWGFRIDPERKTPEEIEFERRAEIARRIGALEEKAAELETRLKAVEDAGKAKEEKR